MKNKKRLVAIVSLILAAIMLITLLVAALLYRPLKKYILGQDIT